MFTANTVLYFLFRESDMLRDTNQSWTISMAVCAKVSPGLLVVVKNSMSSAKPKLKLGIAWASFDSNESKNI